MKKTISLNGPWRMRWCDIGAGTPDNIPESPVLPYTVPGDVHTPLIDAGLISEPLEGLNSLDCPSMARAFTNKFCRPLYRKCAPA